MRQAKSREPVAIIGLGLRLPDADSLDAFWDHLAAGRSLIREVPRERWDAAALKGNPASGNETASVWGGFVDGADCFDAAFFGISPREAAWMDPQQRMALEMAWHAIEDAGYSASELAGSRAGVYMGVCHWDYAELLEKHLAQVDAYTPTGIAFSIIANRISHFFDFSGPSITNDTACAASMTALHEAVRALQDGDCDLALAGGVNLIWSPNHFVAFSKAGMLSKDGKAKVFDDRADGYVRGEGGAVLLLKPLDRALADGDPVHAVIRGIGLNHGGRTNSLTVTNPQAQAELIARVMREADVASDTVSYVEAHGTGTPLGDPIEIAGLKQAFAERAGEAGGVTVPESCGIGSLKTNIGHLEGAAGVAGIVKVIAALRHGRLPPNAGFEALNRLIELADTPFRIQKETTDWPRSDGRPRRACVSSFGFGGSNGHVLLEEPPLLPTTQQPFEDAATRLVIPLSARSEDRLPLLAQALLAFIEREDGPDISLADIALTYQSGRVPMSARRAFVVNSMEGLAEALRAYVQRPDVTPRVLANRIDDAATDLAGRWVEGESVAWPSLAGLGARRIPAPLYPFARERHWMDLSLSPKDQRVVPHPFLHRNLSGLEHVEFETRFTGDEFVFADHHVGGVPVLPGVVALEMGRAAARLSGALNETGYVVENIVWASPMRLNDGRAITARTSLTRDDVGGVKFAIASRTADREEERQEITRTRGTIRATSAAAPPHIDLAALKQRLSNPVSVDSCYGRLRTSGVVHGPAFRAIRRIFTGDNAALAHLKLPRRLTSSIDAMSLHPVLLDAAIQPWIAISPDASSRAGVPFACAGIEVHGPCTTSMWAHVRVRSHNGADGVRHLDIDLVDEAGALRVRFHDLALRLVTAGALPIGDSHFDGASDRGEADGSLVLARGAWSVATLRERMLEGVTPATRVLLWGWDEATAQALAVRTGCSADVLAHAEDDDLAAAVSAAYMHLHALLRDAMRMQQRENRMVLVLARDSADARALAPLAALLRTATIENPRIWGRLVTISERASTNRLVGIVAGEVAASDRFSEVRYDGEDRRFAWTVHADGAPDAGSANFAAEPEGTYWITGGLGGLGLVFADWLIARGATSLVLSGRRPHPDAKAETALRGMRAKGAEVAYLACDIASREAVEEVVAHIRAAHGPLRGVIHAAGTLDDGYVLTQDAARAQAVFAPKVTGTMNLDRATADEALDFFLVCSSMAAVFGNAGQGAYAAANAFMDAFVEHRERQVSVGERHGRSRAVAWPLWRDGGMSVDAATLDAMKRRIGLMPLPTSAGISVLDHVLSREAPARCALLYGEGERIKWFLVDFGRSDPLLPCAPAVGPQQMAATAPPAKADNPRQVADMDTETLVLRTADHVRDILADVLQIDAGHIRLNRKLEDYGLDSIAIVETTNRLEETFGPLSKTLFFEYVDLESIAEYLVSEHPSLCARLVDDGPSPGSDLPGTDGALCAQTGEGAAKTIPAQATPTRNPSPPAGSVADDSPDDGSLTPHDSRSDGAARKRHDIAIVGLSLHVSGATDQESFWRMLSEGIDGFEPVPSERWDNTALHHDERDVLGKTVVKTGCFLPDIDKFDPRYFRISQAEAELMSPEVRLFLQASVEAFEDAGYSRETMARRYGGDVAVIVGSMTNEYDLYGFQNMLVRGSLVSGSYTGTMPNMVSYFYGLTGPSYFLDTMCSASSTCVHEAVHMLRAGRCKMALAGGVSLLLHPQKLIATSQEHFTTKSADVIRGYGLGAEGTILGEGVGALVLKPLADAQADGDRIHGVIIGSGISNAGMRNGFTVPSPAQQAVAIEKALEDAAISASSVGYIEGHGSGTALGDPIEVKALTQVFCKASDAVQAVPLGTVKSNIAHLLGASGLAGIAKVLAQLKHRQLAPSLHAETLNPDIAFETSPFYVQRELAPWRRLSDGNGAELPRRAGVTSIGAGGMNAHILIEEPPQRADLPDEGAPELLVFSALDATRLDLVLARFAEYLRADGQERLADIAWTLQVGRNELICRLAFIAWDATSALAAIEDFLANGGPGPGVVYVRSILDADAPRDRVALRADCEAGALDRVADAWCRGAAVDWELLRRDRQLRRVSLPAYPFDKVRCWYQAHPDAPSVLNPMGARSKLHPFVASNVSDASGLRYRTTIHMGELRDYIFTDRRRECVVALVAAEIAVAAGRIAGLGERSGLADLRIVAEPDWGGIRELEIHVDPLQRSAGGRVRIETRHADDKVRAWAETTVTDNRDDTHDDDEKRNDLAALRARATETLDAGDIYATLKARGLSFGPYLETIDEAWRLRDGGLLCAIRADAPQQDHFKRNTVISAPALAGAYQALLLSLSDGAVLEPRGIERGLFADEPVSHLLCRRAADGRYTIQFLGEGGRIVGALYGLAVCADVAALTQPCPQSGASAPQAQPADGALSGVEALRGDLREAAARILKFSPEDLSARETFHDLGFDSISLARYANDIAAAYGIDLSPAIFFECENIEALATHLIERHGVTTRERSATASLSTPERAAPAAASSPASISVNDDPRRALPQEARADERIAIIGMAGRFPQSPDVDVYFDNLLAGRDLVGDLPLERYSPDHAARFRDECFPLCGGFLDDVDRFDAALFKISPFEAERMDPQQRLLLETTWRALENAGRTPEELPRDTGVFVGITSLDYAELWRAQGLVGDGYVATGNSLAMAANRLSYALDSHGPSQAIDTACSSSLIAMLRARDALRLGQCSTAIVAGVNLCLSLDGFTGPHRAGMLSSSGRCHTFGARADGYVRGEGVAVLVLKRLSAAERDGDRILGVMAGGAENHGGRAGALTAPNAKAQARLIVDAMSGIDPRTIAYIEAHGTGTNLGDPIEINGLSRAFESLSQDGNDRRGAIGLTAVKSNIGHLEAAAGLAGVVKLLMAMQRNEMPPTLHCTPVNPHIQLGNTPFRLVTQREPWPPVMDAAGHPTPRRAGVSSFGFGGSNAHIVLESYDAPAGGVQRQPLPARPFAQTRFWIPLSHNRAARYASHATASQTLHFVPGWTPRDAEGPAFVGRRIVVGCGIAIATDDGVESVALQTGGMDIAERYAHAAVGLLALLRQEVARPGQGAVLVQLAVSSRSEDMVFTGLAGMLRTVVQEDPRLAVQTIELPHDGDPAEFARLLEVEARGPCGAHSRYIGRQRHVREWREQADEGRRAHRWRDGGVYLVTGGMGGLGRLVACDIADTADRPILVLAGSGPLDAEREAVLRNLREKGAVVAYRRVDMGERSEVMALVAHVVEVHGGVDGVLHCAGTLRDGALASKSESDLVTVLAPKVTGALALRDACAGLDIDDFVLFSSLAGPFGNPGQADYAAANGFLDALANRSGGILKAIDWPLWRDGGMRIDTATEERLRSVMGQRPLAREEGIAALHMCLAGDAPQTAVLAGDGQQVRDFFARDGVKAMVRTTSADQGSTSGRGEPASPTLLARTRAKLNTLFARVSGLSESAIDPFAPLDDYGIDSLMITRLNDELGEPFEALPRTLFFRHRTLAAVAEHLVGEQPRACRNWTGERNPAPLSAPEPISSLSLGSPPAEIRDTSIATRAREVAEPIAIIGMSGAYPDAPDLQTFWKNLAQGHDAIREIPLDRWSMEGFFEANPDEAAANGKSYSRWGGFLDGFADFDAAFFKISPRDAAAMDPQERLFLTCAWQVCEDAGYSPSRLKAVAGESARANVGVFVGVTKTGFALHGPFPAEGGAMVRPMTSFAGIANRVSHHLDLCGVSMPVDTMCSSSLSAIHEACEHLRTGACAMAIAGGVNIYLHPSNYVELSAARMLSPTGRCCSFGADADGFVPGEGVGCVLLKPLSRALADGDRIHALILGSAVNHGGRTNGYTVPNPLAQRDVIRAALERAGVNARDIAYVEAHGTGTNLGDPIELDGLTQAFAVDTGDTGFCALGSVKSQIGHLEAAAGIAGLTKVVLQMHHGRFAPSLHAETVNSNLDFAATPFVLQHRSGPWRAGGRRLAGISSFGAGGANAHLVVSEWTEPQATAAPGDRDRCPEAVLLSARTPERLRACAQRLLAFLQDAGPASDTLRDGAEVLRQLRVALADILAVAPHDIDPQESFDALGLDTAQAVALLRAIESAHGVALARSDLNLAGTLQNLCDVICADADPTSPRNGPALADIAYTLQLGREAMECKLAILASDTQDLAHKLQAWAEEGEPPAGVFHAPSNGTQSAFAAFGDDPLIRDVVARAWESGQLDTLARLWAEGVPVPWHTLRAHDRGRIVSLPTYPFEKNRFWIPTTVAGGLERVVTAGRGDAALANEAEILEKAIAGVLAALLHSLGDTDIPANFAPWIETAKTRLAERGRAAPMTLREAWSVWQEERASGRNTAQMALADVALKALPDIIAGRERATNVLFPEGRATFVEAVYKENAVAARFSETIAQAAARIVTESGAHDIRILEIGAGTGGTSEPVFKALAPHFERLGEYLYTDVSKAFLVHAERAYADTVACLRTALFDVERSPADQGLHTGRYDIVIAANVLHATADIERTLAHVRQLLVPGGILLLNETSRATLFTHVTFGLLEGWWRFSDHERRIPGTPSLTPLDWRHSLERSDFVWLAGSNENECALGQQIIAARAARENPHTASTAMPATAVSPAAIVKTAAHRSPLPAHGARETVRDTLFTALGETLNVAPGAIDGDKSFADYGLDSILGAEFAHRLRKALGIAFDQTALFDYTSASRLEAHLIETHPHLTVPVPAAPLPVPAAHLPESQVPAHPATALAKSSVSGEQAGQSREPIAIVGASGRFAGSATIDALWQHLVDGDDLVEPVSRFDLTPFHAGSEPGSYGCHGSFIEGIDRFDPTFFAISGLEATYMDPQQRLFLEEAWKALENAGHAGSDIVASKCGVFVGCAHGDYQDLFTEQPPGQAFWGNTTSLIPARISYWLDLKGPAIAIDTACSSSLVAIHTACRSLWAGECDMALAGGVFVQSSPRFFRYANAATMLSPSGRCASFGAGADGIVPGEAVGAVLLRPLKDALGDGDTVLGVIAATGTNQDGTTNGITAPSAASQERLIRQVYEDFGIDAASIDVVEAHGTGTPLGDPIEYQALVRAFEGIGPRNRPIHLGSVKSNIGHATTAAGIAGLAKVLWSLKNQTIPPSLHFSGGNPAIDFATGPFHVNEQRVAWPAQAGRRRRAAISSFGFSGTNAHIVVEEGPEAPTVPETTLDHLFVLSARMPDQLRQQAERLCDHLDTHRELRAEDVAFTLMVGRRAFNHRLALVEKSVTGVATRLRAWLADDVASGVETSDMAGASAGSSRVASFEASSAASSTQRREALRAQGQAFLAGGSVETAALFSTARKRVALPTYPFAARSYWVPRPQDVSAVPRVLPEMPLACDTTGGRIADVGQLTPRSSEAPSACEATGPVRLAAPVEMVASIVTQSAAPTPAVSANKVTLMPLETATPHTKAIGNIARRDGDDGVRVLDIAGAWDEGLASRLSEELQAAGGDETIRAVVITGDFDWGSTSIRGWNPDSVMECTVPVVVAARAAVSGEAVHLALCCDFLIMGKAACLSGYPTPVTDLTRLAGETRLGAVGLRRLRADAQTLWQAELAEAAPGIVMKPAGGEDAAAVTLARQIAAAPRLPLVLLKQHMRADLAVSRAPVGKPDTRIAIPLEQDDIPATRHTSRSCALRSSVVELELFDDGVALIRMLERDGRNMFTPALMDGLEEAFAAIAAMEEAKIVVLTGHDGYFACGGTAEGLKDLQGGDSHFTDRRIYALPLSCALPIIAAMQGHAIGAGWALGMACDASILAAEGVYHSNYLWYGFTPGAGATLVMPHRLGDDLGREVLFSAREYRGRELGARSRGITVRPGAQVLQTGLAAAHALAAQPREHLLDIKRQVAAPLRAQLDAVLEKELAMHRETLIGNSDVRARIAEKFGECEPRIAPHPAPGADNRASAEAVIASLAEELMIEASQIRRDDSFLDLGLDSILAVTWIRKLNSRFAVALPATAVYAHPSVGALADHVAALSGEKPAPVEMRANGALREAIIASLAEDLMIDPGDIADTMTFLDLGLDSILAVTWVRKLNARHGVAMPATVVYAHPTVGDLVGHVASLVPSDQLPDDQSRGHDGAPAERSTAPAPSSAPNLPTPALAFSGENGARVVCEPVAIIGAAGTFPKARDLSVFWENIRQGHDCIDEVPASRWDTAVHFDPDPQAAGKTYCKWMGALDEPGHFDARFFSITPREAELMDPQQRLFLQTAWHAFEDAAIDPRSLAGSRCGVYVSSGPSGYADLIEERNAYSLLGSSGSILAARISYLLDLRGPCLSIDTACSSSLVALAQACESLASGLCDTALAGGACVLVGPNMFIDTAKVSMLSPEGRCFTFDERANGFVPGEGVGAVFLKRLADAQRDGDPIRAVVRAWGVNQDGRTNGITAPNPNAQSALLRDIYERFDIDPATIGMIECHGTGTPLGDPIEVEGLSDVFQNLAPGDRCALGSVKSNVGHLLASAGIAGALKAMLALENREIPPSINVERLNIHIPLERTPFFVSRELSDWKTNGTAPRRAGVSAFGFSGTNAHVVLEQAPPRHIGASEAGPQVFVLSARDSARLSEWAAALERFVAAQPQLDLASLAHTLQTGRSAFTQRAAVVASTRDELLRALSALAAGQPLEGLYLSAGDRQAVELFGTDDDAKALTARWLKSRDSVRLAKAARLWACGVDLEWPAISGASRLRLPLYPFASTRYWVDDDRAADSRAPGGPDSHGEMMALPAFGASPEHGEIGRQLMRIAGDEPFLTTHLSGEWRLSLGLFLPEFARSTLERLTGVPVRRLSQLLWGHPVAINSHARTLSAVAFADGEGMLYQIEVDEVPGVICHLGAARSGSPHRPPCVPLAELSVGIDITVEFERFARQCAVVCGPPTPEMATVSAVRRTGPTLTARLTCPRQSAARRSGMMFDPYYLDALWRLLTFAAGDTTDPQAQLVLPYAVEQMAAFKPAGDQAIARVTAMGDALFHIELFDTEGQTCMRLEGVSWVAFEEARDILLGEEAEA